MPYQLNPTVPPEMGEPSPLLIQPSEFVLLHFQLAPGNRITSPQRPVGDACQQAIICCGLTQTAVDTNEARLQQIGEIVDYEQLLALCPETRLPSFTWSNSLSMAGGEGPAVEDSIKQLFVDPHVEDVRNESPPQAASESGSSPSQTGAAVDPASSAAPEFGGKQSAQQSRSRQRGDQEYNERLESAQNYALSQWTGNSLANISLGAGDEIVTPDAFVSEGIMRPLWIEDQLLLARRVENQSGTVIQCCWLDWERIRTALRDEVRDLLPEVEFEPVGEATEVRLGQVLATLPVQLQIDRPRLAGMLDLGLPEIVSPQGGGIWLALLMAWVCLVLAAIGGAVLLQGLWRLSERRGAFVSAVTHELRTPLTTFRMYAEMLAERMVPTAEKQRQYAETMRIEADRLSHLVENVLQFARIERVSHKCRREETSWDRLMDRFENRLRQRAEQAAMELVVEASPDDAARSFWSDPVAIEQVLFNLVDNACKYARSASVRRIEVRARFPGDQLEIRVRDHGPGVCPRVQRHLFQPFRKSDQQAADTAQGVGLGLALCRRMAKSLGGRLRYEPASPGTEMVLTIPATGR
jgi:signal transduction histidine kinase